jgi:hypothetical protein
MHTHDQLTAPASAERRGGRLARRHERGVALPRRLALLTGGVAHAAAAALAHHGYARLDDAALLQRAEALARQRRRRLERAQAARDLLRQQHLLATARARSALGNLRSWADGARAARACL